MSRKRASTNHLFWKRTTLLATLFAVYGIFLFTPAAATLQQLQVGMEAPDFSLPPVSGEKRSLETILRIH